MKQNLLGTEQLTVQDDHGLRMTRTIKLGDRAVRRIILQPPSDDRITALGKQGPVTLTMPEEGVAFQTLGVQLWPPHSEEEAAQIRRAVPNLLGVDGTTVEDVHCYDPENLISWQELQVTRPETAGAWTPEAAIGLLNAVHLALTTEILPPTGDALALPVAS